jgi:hypothetical protein
MEMGFNSLYSHIPKLLSTTTTTTTAHMRRSCSLLFFQFFEQPTAHNIQRSMLHQIYLLQNNTTHSLLYQLFLDFIQ